MKLKQPYECLLQKHNLRIFFYREILIYGVFAQHGPLKTRIFHPESFCTPNPATRKVFVFSASGVLATGSQRFG